MTDILPGMRLLPASHGFQEVSSQTLSPDEAYSSAQKPYKIPFWPIYLASPTLPLLSSFTTSKHIIFEGHPLIKNNAGPLYELFKMIFQIAVNEMYMTVRCHSLSTKSQIISIQGILLWLIDNETDSPMSRSEYGHSARVLWDLRLSKIGCFSDEEFALIAEFFLNTHDITIAEIQWIDTALRLKLSGNIQVRDFACQIGGFVASYDTTSAIPSHDEAAKKLVAPTELSSGVYGSSELFSLGVAADDQNGDKWFTVASNSFSSETESFHHPNANHAIVSWVNRILGGTGISSARLKSGLNYGNKTFDSDLKSSVLITILKKSAWANYGKYFFNAELVFGYCGKNYIVSI